jgi:hypothetical protein
MGHPVAKIDKTQERLDDYVSEIDRRQRTGLMKLCVSLCDQYLAYMYLAERETLFCRLHEKRVTLR